MCVRGVSSLSLVSLLASSSDCFAIRVLLFLFCLHGDVLFVFVQRPLPSPPLSSRPLDASREGSECETATREGDSCSCSNVWPSGRAPVRELAFAQELENCSSAETEVQATPGGQNYWLPRNMSSPPQGRCERADARAKISTEDDLRCYGIGTSKRASLQFRQQQQQSHQPPQPSNQIVDIVPRARGGAPIH